MQIASLASYAGLASKKINPAASTSRRDNGDLGTVRPQHGLIAISKNDDVTVPCTTARIVPLDDIRGHRARLERVVATRARRPKPAF